MNTKKAISDLLDIAQMSARNVYGVVVLASGASHFRIIGVRVRSGRCQVQILSSGAWVYSCYFQSFHVA